MVRAVNTVVTVVSGVVLTLGAIWLFQRRLIYFPEGAVPPAARVAPGAVETVLRTFDGLELGAWFLPARGRAVGTVVVFNGNAGNRSHRAPLAAALVHEGFSVLLFDYRGYGGNPGRPTEAGLLADARAARAYLESRADVDSARVSFFGESLGAAVALAEAVERPPAALVLRSPFASLDAVARFHYPLLPSRLLLRDRFPSIERIRKLACPLLVVAGERDRIVPLAQSRALFEAAPAVPRRFVSVPGADHNDPELLDGARLIRAVSGFLRDLSRPGSPRGDPPGVARPAPTDE